MLNTNSLTIRTLLVSLAIVEIVVAVGLTGWLAFQNGRKSVDQMTIKVLEEMISQVKQNLNTHINGPILLAQLNKDSLDLNQTSLTDIPALEKHFWSQSRNFPDVAYFSFGYSDGEVVGIQVNDDGSTHLQVTEKTGNLLSYSLNKSGERDELINTKPDFDPRERQWYTIPLEKNGPAWTPIYSWFDPPTLAMTYSAPYADSNNEWQGMLAFDLTLAQISDYFRSLKIGKSGDIFIIENDGSMVSTSGESAPFIKKDNKVRRIKAEDSTDELIQKTTQFIKSEMSYPLQLEQDINLSFMIESEKIMVRISPFNHSSGLKWNIVVVLPESDFMGPIHQSTYQTVLLCLIILLVAILVQLRSARWISFPIANLSQQVGKITDFRFDNNFDVNSPIHEVLTMSRSLETMQAGLHSFNRYVPSSLVRQLINKGNVAQLGGSRHLLTVMFTDIAGFTSIAEKIEPESLMHHLSDYLDALSKNILEQNGTIDKYIGDAIMCFWGAPIPIKEQADRACMAALICQKTNVELNVKWQSQGLPALPTRMGIHTGISIVGNIGSSNRLNYTALGDNINLAARLESVNKQYGTFILISEDTRTQLTGDYLTRPVDIVALKGKEKSILIHELVAGSFEDSFISATSSQKELCVRFTNIFSLYQQQDWTEAASLLKDLIRDFPEDALSKIYLHRCQSFMENPPEEGWDGVFRMKTK